MNEIKEILSNCFHAGRRFENGNHPRQTFEEWYEANDIEAKVLKISSKQDVINQVCDHNWISSVAYKGAKICSKCSELK